MPSLRRSGRRSRKGDPAAKEVADEREWEEWWRLRDELGKRLGGRGAAGVSDPEVLEAARLARDRERRRRR